MKENARRIKRMEARLNDTTAGNLGRLAGLIAQGAFYDELTEEEKNAYCSYRGFDREAMETVEQMVTGTLHFQIERKPRPLTEAELKERAEEVQEYMNKAIEEYNSPEEKAKREKEYLELCEKGRTAEA